MKSTTRTLAAVSTAGLILLGGAPSARAVPVLPIVSNSTAAAVSAGLVPQFIIDFPVPVDVQPTTASVATTLTNPAGGAEAAQGAAAVNVDTTDINASIVRARSQVSTATSSPPAPDTTHAMTNGSVAGFNATLSTAGLLPGGTATVDIALTVRGSLIYSDPGGRATTVVIEEFAVPDISANVSVILALADVFAVVDPLPPIPDPLPLRPLFNGSATLQSPDLLGGAPNLVRAGDWADPIRDADFVPFGACTATSCQYDVMMTLNFVNVQSLGFGETFDIGLLLQTNAEAISEEGRGAASLFFDSASIVVALTAPVAAVPEPGTLMLLAVVIAGLARRGAVARRLKG